MTSTYIAIDQHSGYVWGVAEADTLCEAAAQITLDTGKRIVRYEECPRREIGAGYHLYEVPEDFVEEARELLAVDADTVESRCRYVGSVRSIEEV